MAEFRMPSLGADMAAGILNQWLVEPGARVKSGDIVAVVETDKGAIEVEVFASGTVKALLVPEGASVPVGTPLAEIDEEEGMEIPNGAHAQNSTAGQAASAGAAIPTAQGNEASVETKLMSAADAVAAGTTRWVRSSPSARALAGELGIDIAQLNGTGPHGAVVRADVATAAASRGLGVRGAQSGAVGNPPPPQVATPSAPPPLVDARAAMRRAIAAAMERSHREIPHYYLSSEIDLRHALSWLGERNATRPVGQRVLPAALLLQAVARTIVHFPELNGHWIEGNLHTAASVDLAVAVSLRKGGLVTPSIHAAETLDLGQLMAALTDTVIRARSGHLRASELVGGSVTVTNLGDLGADAVFGVIYPPQVALVGFGRVVERPVAVNGMLTVRPVVRVSLAADHRASDGHRGSLFLAALERFLQEPEKT